jgi:hypothetical protein
VCPSRVVFHLSYTTLLQTYTISDLLELNDITEEELLEFLVEEDFIHLPEIQPLEFD